jgi:endonuclease-3 related protein
MPASTNKALVRSLYKRLYQHYGPQSWWPARSAWEMMVGAILTQNTSWNNVDTAIRNLRQAGVSLTSVEAIASMPRGRLEKLIRSSGYFRQKAERLQKFARVLRRDPTLFQSRERLLAQPGIGPETADSILLYAAKKPVFVVDAYTRRIGQRLGLFKTDDYHEVQEYFQRGIAHNYEVYNEYHALLVRLAKEVCTKRNPRCTICPVKKGCLHRRKLE